MKMQALTSDETDSWLGTVTEARTHLSKMKSTFDALTSSMYELHCEKYSKSVMKFLLERYDSYEEFMESSFMYFARRGMRIPLSLCMFRFGPQFDDITLQFIHAYSLLDEKIGNKIDALYMRWAVHAHKPFQIDQNDVRDFSMISQYNSTLRNACREFENIIHNALPDESSVEHLLRMTCIKTSMEP